MGRNFGTEMRGNADTERRGCGIATERFEIVHANARRQSLNENLGGHGPKKFGAWARDIAGRSIAMECLNKLGIYETIY